jgi:hypothetical protein
MHDFLASPLEAGLKNEGESRRWGHQFARLIASLASNVQITLQRGATQIAPQLRTISLNQLRCSGKFHFHNLHSPLFPRNIPFYVATWKFYVSLTCIS